MSLKSVHNLQFEVDQLSKSLKKIRGVDDVQVEESLLSHFDWTRNSDKVAIESIRDWYKSTQYRSKYYFYKKLLQDQMDAYSISWEQNYFSFEQTFSQAPILRELIRLADALSVEYNQELEKKFNQLETLLRYSVTAVSPFSYFDISSVGEISDKCLLEKAILHTVRDLRKLLTKTFNRDLRSIFRAIIRFHFKNMDDESHDVNVLKNTEFKQSFTSKRFTKCKIQLQRNTYSRYWNPAI